MITLEELQRQIKDIPPPPAIALRLLRMMQDPACAPRDFVEVIRYDSAMTAKVLRLCNSAFYGLARSISSLQEAVVYLGVDAVVGYVLAGCFSDYCRHGSSGYSEDSSSLWLHSVGCALCCQKIAEKRRAEKPAVAFTAGLLHDFGKIVLNNHVAEDYRSILALVEERGMPFEEAERKIVGYSHAEAGAAIAEAWSIPPELIDVVLYHHSPMRSTMDVFLCATVHIGDLLCVSYGVGMGIDGLAYRFDPSALDVLRLSDQDFAQISIEFTDAFKQIRESLLV